MVMTETEKFSITAKIAAIRDGTHGISLSTPDRIIGEWQDTGACSLKVTDEYTVSICGQDGQHRYFLILPGKPVSSRFISDTEAVVAVVL